MSIHTKLVGALDAIILSILVPVMVVMMGASLNPSLGGRSLEALGPHATVTIEQIA